MAKQTINNGTAPNDGTGESLYSATAKINENFTELYGLVVGGGDTTFVNSITAGSGISVSGDIGDITITNTLPYVASFTSLAVTGQDTLLSSRSAALTFAAGNNITLTTEAIGNRIVIAAASQVQSDWDAVSGVASILNKPSIPTDINQLADTDGLIIPQDRFGNFWFYGTEIVTDAMTGIDIISQTSTQISWTDTGEALGPTRSNFYVDSTGAHISCLETVGPEQIFTNWDFNSSGALSLPSFVTLKASDNTIECPSSVDTVFYTTTQNNQATIKITVSIEGAYGTSTGDRDTHSCEIMVAKAVLGDVVQLIEYGTIYTSAGPLATFTASWNPSLTRVEVKCQPTSTVNSVFVRSFATELAKSN